VAWYARGAELAPTAARTAVEGSSSGNLSTVGMVLFTRFALPFEIASLILLAAIVGAVVLARKGEP
jgi:NADH:ubiquinone oxidoreductase subunit 6 (subunit J)